MKHPRHECWARLTILSLGTLPVINCQPGMSLGPQMRLPVTTRCGENGVECAPLEPWDYWFCYFLGDDLDGCPFGDGSARQK